MWNMSEVATALPSPAGYLAGLWKEPLKLGENPAPTGVRHPYLCY